VGATVGLRAALLTRSAMAAAAEAVVEGSAGSFDFARASVTARASAVVSSRFAAALEGSAGTSAGAVPAQGRFFLGGPATLRGYTGAAAVGTAFWRARAELANSLPAVRLALFADAGWAGDRAAFGGRRPLIAVGTGVSLMDGLLRVDLAKGLRAPGGWRLDFSVDGVL
jgi:hemolysin activation/secretion protein